ncbi:MAG: Vitamin K epoxide reductase family protein [Candidatus Pacebacteria bacterium GW2011_GWB1_47_8]|nr:MAG: Vitamin K epoxide reductase family protein [Candidatus Pacebacteria bacterium GW2011_GWA1_46_10]KKU84548.1 MAG: Vitamin K epoxide reductase family protein [Candidatus Pacebacteria bacterium GW2011_GWB1_47_8]
MMNLALVGILLALYLYYEYYTKRNIGVCDINSVFSCGPVTTGSLSELFGMPVALIGLVGYLVIFITAFFKRFKWAFFMATFGMLFCLRITFLEIFVEQVLCPVCLACQAVMIAEFILTLQLAYPKKFGLLPKKSQ